jgi:hypothetical protein
MPEGMNIEVAHKLSEQEKTDRHKRRWEEVAELVEVLFLAIAAIATAWSGYQAAKGEGHQSVLYGQATSDQFGAAAAATLGASSWPRTRPCSTAGCRPGRPTTPNSSMSSFAGSP